MLLYSRKGLLRLVPVGRGHWYGLMLDRRRGWRQKGLLLRLVGGSLERLWLRGGDDGF